MSRLLTTATLTLGVLTFLSATAALAPVATVPPGFNVEAQKSIQFSLKSSLFATYQGFAKNVSGQMEIDPKTGHVSAGTFTVSIQDMTTDNSKRDCHMRQTLGLDYTVSDYPDKHVCDDNDQLPTTGPNSVKFPNVTLKILALNDLAKMPLDVRATPETSSVDGIINVLWSIHGREVAQEISVKLERVSSQTIQIQGQTKLSLKSFGAVVKKFGIVGVDDTIRVKVDVPLEIR